MSEFGRKLENCDSISTWESLEMACHFIYQYHQRLLGKLVGPRFFLLPGGAEVIR